MTRTYDPSGTLQSEASQRNGSVVSYGYVGAYLPQTVSLDGAEVARFAYEADYLRSIQASGASFGFEYDDQGRRTALTRPNGIRTTYSYTANLPWLEHIGIEGSAAALDATYTHDAVGNRLAKTAGDVAEQYGYDPLDRLTSVMRTAPLSSQSSFGYDAVGNRTRQQIDGMSRSLSTDAANRLLTNQPMSVTRVTGTTSEPANVTVQGQTARILPGNVFEAEASASGTTPTITVQATDGSGNTRTNTYQLATQTGAVQYSYDLNGNLLTKTEGSDSWVYTWNAENQLTRVQKSGTEVARFAYDPLGRRVEKIAGGVTTRYTYHGDDILREAHGSATLQYVHGPGIDEPLAMTEGGTRTYFHADGLGSIVATTDATGSVASRRQYDAWGNLEVGAGQPGHAFTGREWDPETGLYYYRARYYDPKIGRFISEDPIGFVSGVNFYAYVGNDPVDWTDPFGLKQCKGLVRILGGNAATVGKQGGVPGVAVAAGSSAVIPSQFGASSGAGLASYASSVSGGFPSAIGTIPVFNGITDVIGSTNIPAGYQNIRDYLQAQYPGRTIIELPTGTDMGTREMILNVPDGVACPPGTYEGNQCSAK